MPGRVIVPGRRPRWLELVFTYRGAALERIRGRLLAVFTVAVAVTLAADHFHVLRTTISVVPFTLVGLALSIFLGFRNNTSYDRFWEGRRLWGALVNATRSYARRTLLFLTPAPGDDAAKVDAVRTTLVKRTIAYVHALRMHLRSGIDWNELARYLEPDELTALRTQRNVPLAILQGTAMRVRDAYRAGHIHPYHLPVLEQTLSDLTDIQGGCERIKNTPIPFSYTVLIHQIVATYCFSLPFGLVETLHEWTPIVVLIVAHAFLSLDAIGDEIEDPFGTDPNDLPLDAISQTIEINLRQALGEVDVPPLPTPVNRLLM
jgi:putative membrane protein